MARGKGNGKKNGNGAHLRFETAPMAGSGQVAWPHVCRRVQAVVLRLIFLKYISDAFEEHHEWLLRPAADPKSDYYTKDEKQRSQIAEDRDEYVAENIGIEQLYRRRAPCPCFSFLRWMPKPINAAARRLKVLGSGIGWR